VLKEVLPAGQGPGKQKAGLMPELVRKAGELGPVWAAAFPEAYGGAGLDKSPPWC